MVPHNEQQIQGDILTNSLVLCNGVSVKKTEGKNPQSINS